MTNLQVAQTILEQLGGRRFIVMTGANSFVGSENSLSFRIPKGRDREGRAVNVVTITLEPSDEYRFETFYLRAGTRSPRVALDGIYCDVLRDVFTRHTGLHTSL